MSEKDITIAHISDLHLPSRDFNVLKEDVKLQKPDLIIVSGDIVNSPLKNALKFAKLNLLNLCEECGFGINKNESGEAISCSKLFVVPGNHDMKWFGFIPKKMKIFESITNQLMILSDKRLPSKIKNTIYKINKKPYYDTFGELRNDFLEELGISIFCFDSNTDDWEVSFARGRIGRKEAEEDQYANLQSIFEKMSKIAGFDSSYKIAVLHHHPVPFADLEYGVDYPGFLVDLEDSGTFLREMTNRGINLILHGHQHHRNIARYSVAPVDHEIIVVGAGSACKEFGPKSPFRSYNIIHIQQDGEIVIRRPKLTTGTYIHSEPSYTLRNYEQYRKDIYDFHKKSIGIECDHAIVERIIDEYGDTSCISIMNGYKIIKEQIVKNSHSCELRTDIGCIRNLYVEKNGINLKIKPEIETETHIKGEALFGMDLDIKSDPINLRLGYKLLNGNALTAESRKKMSDGPEPSSWDSTIRRIRIPTKDLCILVTFPHNCIPENHFLEVYKDDNSRCHIEERWVKNRVHYSKVSNTIFFHLHHPLPQHSYKMTWRLPIGEKEFGNLPAEVHNHFKQIIQSLLSLRSLDENDDRSIYVTESLIILRDYIIRKYSSNDTEKTLDVCLMVFDDRLITEERKWRIVGLSSKRSNELWNFNLRFGDGLAGRSAKIKKYLHYISTVAKVDEETNYYIEDDNLSIHPEVIHSIPLAYPFNYDDGAIFSILNITSSKLTSHLVKFEQKTDYVENAIKDIRERAYGILQTILIKKFGIKKFRRENFV